MSDDQTLWSDYAKRVKRVGKKTPAPKLAARKKPAVTPRREPVTAAPMHPVAPITQAVSLLAPACFDRRVERQLKQGAIRLDAKLDLHGMTQAVAHAALTHFVADHVKRGSRKLLIVTGKGASNTGVLKASLPRWLHELPQAHAIIDLRPAAPRHGGSGAFYVWLKKGVRI